MSTQLPAQSYAVCFPRHWLTALDDFAPPIVVYGFVRQRVILSQRACLDCTRDSDSVTSAYLDLGNFVSHFTSLFEQGPAGLERSETGVSSQDMEGPTAAARLCSALVLLQVSNETRAITGSLPSALLLEGKVS
jgi:hypothetical protein